MVVEDGRYSGAVEFYAGGPHKVRAVRELAEARGYPLEDCYAYSDSITDAPLLEAVGHPTAVNPDKALRREAVQRGWPILTFADPVALRRFRSPQRRATLAVAGLGAAALVGASWYGRRSHGRPALARLRALIGRRSAE
jgi:hypothetical protein